jgi:hypothetical protein
MTTRRLAHVRPVTRAAKHRWAELHPQEPAWRLAVGLVGLLLTMFAFFWLLPATQVAP